MGYLTWWSIPKRAWILIISEFVIIALLSSWVYVQYLSDTYFQAYVNGLAPVLVPALSVTFGICSASLAAYLYIGMRKIRAIETSGSEARKNAQPKKAHREPAHSSHPDLKPSLAPNKPKPRPLTTPRYHTQDERMHAKEREPSSEV